MSSSAHPADGDLRALLDGELPPAQRVEVEQHARTCAVCRARVAALESAAQETAALLALLPTAAPDLRIETIVSRARAPRLRWGVIAAALALVVASVAGATVGRPYVRALVVQIRAVVHPKSSAPSPASRGGQVGIAFILGSQADISFDAPQSSGAVYVSLADTAKVVIVPSAAVTYRVHPGGVIVHNVGSSASYDIVVPRNALHVRILVAGRVLFEKAGSRVTAPAPAEPTGRYAFDVR